MIAALLAGIATAVLLVWLEVRRADRRRLGWRIAATIAAVTMLVLMWLEPATARTARATRAVLLTHGASMADARALADSSGAATILTLDSVRDLAALRRGAPGVSELVLAGWGLPAEELERSGNLALGFSPAPLPAGILELRVPPRIALGEQVTIRGRTGARAAWVRLTGPGIAPDSARSDSAGGFELEFLPKAAGLQLFVLSANGATDTAAVDVRKLPEPKLLMLLGRPDFEATLLRRRISDRGGAVASRTTLSRGRVRREALNGAPMPGGRVDSTLLAWADIVVIDGAAAATLTPVERAALSAALVGDGIGVIADAAAGSQLGLEAPDNARPATTRPGTPRELRVRVPGGGGLLPPIGTEPIALADGPASEVVLEDPAGRPLAVATGIGAGRIAVSSVRNPSRWLLAGDGAAFDRYWTALIAAVRRPRAEWRVGTPLIARVGRPVELAWPGALAEAVVVGDDRQDIVHFVLSPDSIAATGRFWPRSPGAWAVAAGGDTLRFLVTGERSWMGLDAADRVERTRLHAGIHAGTRGSAVAAVVREKVPPPIFWAAFLLSAGWLWWERRRSGGGKEGRTGVR